LPKEEKVFARSQTDEKIIIALISNVAFLHLEKKGIHKRERKLANFEFLKKKKLFFLPQSKCF
jgi:hypothetical protein